MRVFPDTSDFSHSTQAEQASDFRPDAFGVLTEMNEGVNDDAAIFRRVEDPIAGVADHQTAHRLLEDGCQSRMAPEILQDGIKPPSEGLTGAGAEILQLRENAQQVIFRAPLPNDLSHSDDSAGGHAIPPMAHRPLDPPRVPRGAGAGDSAGRDLFPSPARLGSRVLQQEAPSAQSAKRELRECVRRS